MRGIERDSDRDPFDASRGRLDLLVVDLAAAIDAALALRVGLRRAAIRLVVRGREDRPAPERLARDGVAFATPRVVVDPQPNDGGTGTERRVERALQRCFEHAGVARRRAVRCRRGSGAAEGKAAVVEDRHVLGREPGDGARDVAPDAVDGRRRQRRARREREPDRRRRAVRRIVGERPAFGGRDDHARVRDAREAAQPARDVAREAVALLGLEHHLRRQRARFRERFGRTREMTVRHPREREPEQQIAPALRIDPHVRLGGHEGDVPLREPFGDLGERVARERCREERDARIALQGNGEDRRAERGERERAEQHPDARCEGSPARDERRHLRSASRGSSRAPASHAMRRCSRSARRYRPARARAPSLEGRRDRR